MRPRMRDTVASSSESYAHMTTLMPEKRRHPKRISSGAHSSTPQRRRDRAGKQQALMQAALRLFASKGYEPTTTREIAAAAGCAEGLIHRYFEGKAGLLRALVEHHAAEPIWELDSRRQSFPNFEKEFVQLVEHEVERIWEKRDFLRVFIARAMVDPSLATTMNRAVIQSRSKAVAERLKRYPECAALLQEDLDVLAQSVSILGLIFGFMRPIVLGQDRTLARNTANRFARFLVRAGISPNPKKLS
jgi:TetR/AcrR family transcriptional regulator, regulator of cefoperazone and chloramphenicol sensitivity